MQRVTQLVDQLRSPVGKLESKHADDGARTCSVSLVCSSARLYLYPQSSLRSHYAVRYARLAKAASKMSSELESRRDLASRAARLLASVATMSSG